MDRTILSSAAEQRSVSKEMIDEAVKEVEEGDIVLLQNEISNVGYAAETRRRPEAKVALNPSPINENLKTIPMNLVDYLSSMRLREKKFPERRVKNRKRSWRS